MRHIGLTAIGMILVVAGAASAAETASATISETGTSGTNFNYAITLHDTGTTTIGSFWYSWIPGYDFLPSTPASAPSPTGWSSNIISASPPDDGGSIQWIASGSANYIQPGGSLTFNFSSPDNFASVTGTSPYSPYAVGTSYIYSHGLFSDGGYQFVVAAPEPASASLLGVAGVMLLKRRRR
jgi:hypothetical protein